MSTADNHYVAPVEFGTRQMEAEVPARTTKKSLQLKWQVVCSKASANKRVSSLTGWPAGGPFVITVKSAISVPEHEDATCQSQCSL